MEPLIYSILNALNKNIELPAIHDALAGANIPEEDIFLAFKAAENLFNAIKQQEKNKPKPLFKRIGA